MAKHLTAEERGFLYRLKRKGRSKAEIAELMGRDRSTIYRELKRNAGGRGYRPKQAQCLADARRCMCRRPCKLEDSDVNCYVKERLVKRWSPDQIGARVRRDSANASDGCPDKRSTIGSTAARRNGRSFCVAAVARRKSGGN